MDTFLSQIVKLIFGVAGAILVGCLLFSVFHYCLKNHLKKVYKVILIIILVLIGIADWILVNKTFPIASLFLVAFQVIAIPIIAWYRPERDFSEIKEELNRNKETTKEILEKSENFRIKY